jgi:hypothetical protein
MDNKLSELSKPSAYKFDHGVMGPGDFKYGTPQMHSTAKDENASPLYSQEYVSALDKVAQFWIGESAGWKQRAEAADQRIAELEAIATEYAGKFQKAQDAAKHLVIMNDSAQAEIAHLKTLLATPVRLPEGLAQKIKVTGYYEALNEMMDCVRAAGFKCVGDE